MHILFIIDCLTSGGKERRMVELLKGLKKVEGIQCSLAIMSYEIYYKEVLEFNIPIHYFIRKTKKDISIFNKLYHFCQDTKPDVIHCWDSMTAVYSAYVCKLLGITFVNGMVIDTPAGLKILYKHWVRAQFVFPFSDIIIGNSNAGLKSYRAPSRKSFCIYNGYNFERSSNILPVNMIRKQLNINTKYIVGMVAEFSILKDYKTYYMAAKTILDSRNDVTFVAIGKNTDADESLTLVAENQQSNFRFLGTKSNIESYINVMDICVLATFTEGISNAIMEYMALGKPVVATSGGGTNEIIQDKITGYLVKKSDPFDLAEKIQTLLNDSELRRQMGSLGKKRVENLFSIDRMVNDYVTVYQKALIK